MNVLGTGNNTIVRFVRIALVAGLGLLVGQTAAAQSDDVKLDTHLRHKIERAERGSDAAPQAIAAIVTVRPEARHGLLQKLRAHGAVGAHAFSAIPAASARLTVQQLRQLARDRDVLSISTDASVMGSALASPVTGTAAGAGYTLRATLGLTRAGQTVQSRSFYNGNVDDYYGTVDTYVRGSRPTSSYGSASRIEVDNDPDPSDGYDWPLIRFDGVFGTGADQIPVGATITSATLTLHHYADGSPTATATLHRMLVDWTSASTWNSLEVSGAGVQFDGIEAASTFDASVSDLADSGAKEFSGPALTATVQEWANGRKNLGWAIRQSEDNGWTFRSANDGTSSLRPVLSITYRLPVDNTSATGSGVTVAVVDSGILEDSGNVGRIKTTRDFTTGEAFPAHVAPLDPYGHGSHVAGIIGSSQSAAKGVATQAQFVSLRVLDAQGQGLTTNVINAIQWAIANRAAFGIDVLNLSLGHLIYEPAATDPLVQAVEAAVRAGITVVASAGNLGRNPQTHAIGYAGITSPGNAPSAITVGSARTFATTTRADDLVSDYSSRGPTWYDAFAKPDLLAPGQHVLSVANPSQALYATFPSLRGPTYGTRHYLHLSGTSMAAAVVSGQVALMIQQTRQSFGVRPSSNALKAMLQRTAFRLADPSGAPYDGLTQGAGALNAIGALELAAALDPTVPVGQAWVAGNVPMVSVVDGQTIGWSDNVVWGDSVLWGVAVDTKLAAWSDNVVWGDADNVVWGDALAGLTAADNVVWGDNYIWGDNVVWGDSFNVVSSNGENVVWGDADNVVWGDADNVVWGDEDNVVWGDSVLGIEQP